MMIMNTKKTFSFFILIFTCFQLFAQTDKIYTRAGDVLVGEFKSMQKAVLVFDTDYADKEFQIDWTEIDGLEIGNSIIYTSDGIRYYGGLKPMLDKGRLVRVIAKDQEIIMPLDDIVQITSIKVNLKERIIISLDAGFSLTKANSVRQTSAQGKASYTGDKWRFNANFSNVGTVQKDVDPTDRTEGGFTITRDIYRNAMIMGGSEFLSNSEQMLDLRSTGRLGVGYYIIRNSRIYFQAGAGLALSREHYGGDNPTKANSFEGLGLAEFNAYNLSDFSFMAQMYTYPSFTDWGRWRVNADISLKYDLPLDFYIKLSYIHNFDSNPLIDVSKNDYVFKSSIGWEWD